MRVDAIVPAYNEAKTIEAVVGALLDAQCLGQVMVVDDGSKDGTGDLARGRGATVYRTRINCGKGQAMLGGLRRSAADAVFFCDADLVGLRSEHVHQLVLPVLYGHSHHACGLRDYGETFNHLQLALPPITGERVVARPILNRVPPDFWSGYKIEAGINEAADRCRGRTTLHILSGLNMRKKWDKVGLHKGIEDMANMAVEVLGAMRDSRWRVV